ncbi:MAG: DUF6036 family nucleotidyltransferase [Kofleriaceae bacterium]
MQRVRDFFGEIDQQWPNGSLDKVRLRIIGCGALMLQTNYERGTKDSDVFDTVDLAAETKEHLLRIAGIDTELAKRRLMYVDIVANGIPFLAHPPLWHPSGELNRGLTRLEVLALDVVDVVVAKLKPFRPNDKADIDAMIERDLVPHDRLVERFRSAVDDWAGGALADRLPHYIKNLNEVERDMLGVRETEIELPSWI